MREQLALAERLEHYAQVAEDGHVLVRVEAGAVPLLDPRDLIRDLRQAAHLIRDEWEFE